MGEFKAFFALSWLKDEKAKPWSGIIGWVTGYRNRPEGFYHEGHEDHEGLTGWWDRPEGRKPKKSPSWTASVTSIYSVVQKNEMDGFMLFKNFMVQKPLDDDRL